MADDEDEVFGGLYEDGHWIWDETTQALVFVSDLPPVKVETVQVAAKVPTAGVEFRDDIDLIEQVRYRRRYQRKLLPGQADLITLQDVKDLVIYTAPIHILSPMLIDLLHLPSTERFLRALIFCCTYYIQVAEEMAFRMAERKTKIRTTTCDVLENEFKENLSDLRLLVAKEYCVMLIGGGDTKKFHHMGSNKKRRSLSDKDARLFESFMQMSVQIVYLALGRQKLRQIELECHRIFKSEIFNTVEHTYKTGYLSQMTAEERKVLLGTNLKYEKKLNTRSPLMNEVFSFRPINFRLMGLGIVKYEEITERLYYLFLVVAGSEEKLLENNMSVGLIGLPRSSFDTTLHPLPGPSPTSKSMSKKSQASSQGASSHSSTAQRVSTKSKVGKSQAVQKLYPTIYLPDREPIDSFFPSDFPEQPEDVLPVSQIQRHRWQTRLLKLTKPSRAFVNI